MRKFYSLALVVFSILLAIPSFAQSNKNMIIYMKDKSVQEIPVSAIDSIAFENALFDVTLHELHPLYVPYTIQPADQEMVYNTMMAEKTIFDQYQSDDEIFKDDMLYFQELAEGWGMSFQDVLGQFVLTGPFSDIHSGLLPDTEYVMWTYGVTLDGQRTTKVYKKHFKTLPVQNTIDNVVAIDYTRSNGALDVTYSPDDDNLYYTAGIMHESSVGSGTDEEITNSVQTSISSALYDYLAAEEPLTNYLENSASKKQSKVTYTGIDPNSTYYIIASYLNNDCCLSSPVTIVKSSPAEGTKSVLSTDAYNQKKMSVKRHLPVRLQILDQMKRLNK